MFQLLYIGLHLFLVDTFFAHFVLPFYSIGLNLSNNYAYFFINGIYAMCIF